MISRRFIQLSIVFLAIPALILFISIVSLPARADANRSSLDIIVLLDVSNSMCSPEQPGCLRQGNADPMGLRNPIIFNLVETLQNMT